MITKDAALAALTPAAEGLVIAYRSALASTKTIMASAEAAIFDSSVRGNVFGTALWAGFASGAVGPMATVGTRDLNTSPQSRVWSVWTPEGVFRVQMKADVEDVRAEQLALFDRERIGAVADETLQSRVILTWNSVEPSFVAMENGYAQWSATVATLIETADVQSARQATPQREVRGKDIAASRKSL